MTSASATATAKFRYIGTTDERTECDRCGKVDLKSTVIIATLDADGNDEAVVYYGSTCAARALSIRGGGRAALDFARFAHQQLITEAAAARATLNHYGLDVTGNSKAVIFAAANRFAIIHRAAHWARNADWFAHVNDMIARKAKILADAALIGA
jgi:hypothetical protein